MRAKTILATSQDLSRYEAGALGESAEIVVVARNTGQGGGHVDPLLNRVQECKLGRVRPGGRTGPYPGTFDHHDGQLFPSSVKAQRYRRRRPRGRAGTEGSRAGLSVLERASESSSTRKPSLLPLIV